MIKQSYVYTAGQYAEKNNFDHVTDATGLAFDIYTATWDGMSKFSAAAEELDGFVEAGTFIGVGLNLMEIANRIGSGRATLGVDGVSFVLDMASLALVSNPHGIAASVFASAWDLYFVTH